MALAKGNTTQNQVTLVSNDATLSHNGSTGTDRLLVVVVFYESVLTLDAVSYNGVAMAKQGSWDFLDDGAGQAYDVWYLADPATGANDVVASFTGTSTYGNCAILAQSFTGAKTTINSAHNDAAATPHSQSITITANSMIMGIANSRYSFDTVNAVEIDGTGFGFASCDIARSQGLAQIVAHTRDANLSSGARDVTIDTISASYKADNTRVEILEEAAPPPPPINIVPILDGQFRRRRY